MKETFLRNSTSMKGRVIRAAIGFATIATGFIVMGATGWGLVVATIGLVTLTAGLFNYNLVTGILGYPVSGDRVQELYFRN